MVSVVEVAHNLIHCLSFVLLPCSCSCFRCAAHELGHAATVDVMTGTQIMDNNGLKPSVNPAAEEIIGDGVGALLIVLSGRSWSALLKCVSLCASVCPVLSAPEFVCVARRCLATVACSRYWSQSDSPTVCRTLSIICSLPTALLTRTRCAVRRHSGSATGSLTNTGPGTTHPVSTGTTTCRRSVER